MLHPNVLRALDEVDAAVFSGDCGEEEDNAVLRGFCERWLRELESAMENEEEVENEEGVGG